MRKVRRSFTLLTISALFTCAAVAAFWMVVRGKGSIAIQFALFGLGISLGPCLAAYALAATRRKQTMRRIVLLTGGTTILGFSLLASANLDLEGFFQLLFAGTAGAAVGHTLVTLIIGPAFFGRLLCGWGCSRAMILELLPLGHGRRPRAGLRWLPFASLIACIAAAAIGFFIFGHHAGGVPGSPHHAETLALCLGFAVYYTAAIALAFLFHDQRAFCKYLCPNLPILRFTSRLSLLKISARKELCNECGACSKVCPMDIDVRAFAVSGKRIGTGECLLCQQCVHACAQGALHVNFAAH